MAYPIRAVSKLTGLSIDTLRAWEKRYKAISPSRIGGGRAYGEADIVRLKLLKEAVDKGHRIGEMAKLTDAELTALLGRSSELAFPLEKPSATKTGKTSLEGLLDLIDRFDQVGADRELSRLAALMSPREFIYEVVIPLMQDVGDRWYDGSLSVAQEHMVSSILRNVLGALVHSYEREAAPATLLFATPGGEQHEFGILAAAMLAAAGGLGVIYLGPSLPPGEILAAADKASAKAVVLGAKGAAGWPQILHDLHTVASGLPKETELWIGGVDSPGRTRELKSLRGLVLKDLNDFERRLNRLGDLRSA
jgi:DNA-binding transcriptional MerR regulator/methylmalonyl-CoA mutase cobalamin-binding subunit